MIINLPRFLEVGRPSWSELEAMLDKMDADAAYKLSFDELRRFYRLYQCVSADLAKLQTFASKPEICEYLESLAARAYSEINETRARGARMHIGRWLGVEFPRVFRRHLRAFQLSLLITVVGAIFGAGAVAVDDHAKEIILPAQFGHLLQDPAQRVKEEEEDKGAKLRNRKAGFSAGLMQNNIHVSIMMLALGMTWGFGTIILLFYNGVILGAVMFDYLRAGQAAFLFGWLLPHGVIEIPAVLIAGQAGLLVAKAMIGGEGRSTMGTRLRALGPDLLSLIAGAASLLVWAGIIEAFFSQEHEPIIPYSAKIAFGVTELLVLVWFLRRRLPGEPTK